MSYRLLIISVFLYIEYNLAFIKKSPIRVFYLIFNYLVTEIRSLSSLLFQRRCAHKRKIEQIEKIALSR